MSSHPLAEGLRQRLYWAIREGVVIAGILVFWIGMALVLTAAVGLIAFLIRTLQLAPLRFVYEFAGGSGLVWTAVTALASATTGLYILVRGGTILIDRYQSSTRPG